MQKDTNIQVLTLAWFSISGGKAKAPILGDIVLDLTKELEYLRNCSIYFGINTILLANNKIRGSSGMC